MSEERYTISSLLSRLVEIEEKVKQFYDSLKTDNNAMLRENFSHFSKEHEEIARKIETTKRETIVEFTLEPISGVNIDKCLGEIEGMVLNREMKILDKSIKIEEKISQLYTDVIGKIAHMSGEASQLLLSSNKKAKKRLDVLKQLQKGL